MLRKTLISMLIVTAISVAVIAYAVSIHDSRVTHVSFYSKSLRENMNVDIYLPPNYHPKMKYPVLYLLHGKDANPNSWMTSFFWFDSIHIDRVATRLIAERKIHPLIIVAPEIDNGYGINTSSTTYTVDGYSRGQYADFITHDLVQYIDSHYSVITSRNGRYIGGFSMGGFAALHAAFTNQNLYSKVGVMSPALWIGGLPASLSWIYPTRADQESRDPITIAKRVKIKIPVFIIEGESDPFYAADLALAHVLKSQSAQVTLRTYPGQHNYAFWRSHATDLLLFFGC